MEESRYSRTNACYDTVESRYEISICRKPFIPPWIPEETESVLLNLGKCSKPKYAHKPRMQKRAEKPSQRKCTVVLSDWSIPWSR